MKFYLLLPLLVLSLLLDARAPARAADTPAPVVKERILTLDTDDGRKLEVTLYAPEQGCTNCALVIFSHGNLATPERYDAVLRAWAAHGLVVAAPLHTDSELYPEKGRYRDDRATRLADWRSVDTALRGSPVAGISLSGQVIAAGHSYGALIALVAGGAKLADPKWKMGGVRKPVAVIALSPPSAIKGLVTREGFTTIAVPSLVETGTSDVLPGFIDAWTGHLEPYEAMPSGLGYKLVFTGMNHYLNGAYGRPTREGITASAPQVERLNREALAFIDAALAQDLPGKAEWESRSDAMVTAGAK